MSLDFSIEKASEIVGSQRKLANELGITQGNLWEMKTGKRSCPLGMRAKIAHIAGHDTTRAILDGLAAKLDPSDEWEQQALTTLQAVIAAFPDAGENTAEKAKNPANQKIDGVVWRNRRDSNPR